MSKKFVKAIKEAAENGSLPKHFNSDDVRRACPGFAYGTYRTFLPKHRKGNPSDNTEHFVQLERGVYELIS